MGWAGLGWATTAHCHGRTVASGLVAADHQPILFLSTRPPAPAPARLLSLFTVSARDRHDGSPATLAAGRRRHVASDRRWALQICVRAGLPARLAEQASREGRGDGAGRPRRGGVRGAAALACTHAWQRTREARMRGGHMQGAETREAAGARTHGHARYSFQVINYYYYCLVCYCTLDTAISKALVPVRTYVAILCKLARRTLLHTPSVPKRSTLQTSCFIIRLI